MTKTYRFGRQRLAWFILFGSFFACLLLTITCLLYTSAPNRCYVTKRAN